jgi:hypothetical protein
MKFKKKYISGSIEGIFMPSFFDGSEKDSNIIILELLEQKIPK